MKLSDDKILLKSKLFYHFFEPISKELSEIDYAILKGEPASFYAYGQFGKRYFNDIDLLISKQDLKLVKTILLSNRFKPLGDDSFSRVFTMGFSHQIMPFVKRIGDFSVYIDVNFNIIWGEYSGKQVDLKEFLNDTVPMKIHNCVVKTLPIIKFFIQLILHHYKDMNSIYLLATERCFTVDKFKDIYNILKNNLAEISLDKLYPISVKYEIVPYVYYVLYYTGQVFNDEILRQYIEAFRTPEGEALLNCYGLCAKEQKEWKCDFKTRLESENLYDLIKDDLTERDKEKIAINRRVFLGGAE